MIEDQARNPALRYVPIAPTMMTPRSSKRHGDTCYSQIFLNFDLATTYFSIRPPRPLFPRNTYYVETPKPTYTAFLIFRFGSILSCPIHRGVSILKFVDSTEETIPPAQSGAQPPPPTRHYFSGTPLVSPGTYFSFLVVQQSRWHRYYAQSARPSALS